MAQLYEAQLSEGKPGSRYGKIKNLKENAALFNFLNGSSAELQTELPSLWEQYIERLSEYMESSGKG